VSVGRLGITLDLTFRIVPNAAVRRDRSDIGFDAVARALSASGAAYASALARRAPASEVAATLSAWDEVQFFWWVPLGTLWKARARRAARSGGRCRLCAAAAAAPHSFSAYLCLFVLNRCCCSRWLMLSERAGHAHALRQPHRARRGQRPLRRFLRQRPAGNRLCAGARAPRLPALVLWARAAPTARL
jgi:hypothetical protein